MYLKYIYTFYKYRNYYYKLLFILKVISICYKMKKKKEEFDEWVFVN